MITTLLVLAGMAGPLFFIAATLYIGSVRPNYSPIRTFISQLCLNGGARWQIATFIVTGTAIAAFGVGLRTMDLDPTVPWWGPWAVFFSGIGLIGIGIHRDDPWLGYPPGASTPEGIGAPVSPHGWAHVAMSGFTGLALAVSIASFSRQWDGIWPTYSIVSKVLFLASYGAALSSGYYTGRREPPGGVAGVFQRLSIFTPLLWIAALGSGLLLGRL